MKESKRGSKELGGQSTSAVFPAPRRGWTPVTSYADAMQRMRIGGSDYGFAFDPHKDYVNRLVSTVLGQRASIESARTHASPFATHETHLLAASDLDWNRHMDDAEIPESVRQEYGEDIKRSATHVLRQRIHGERWGFKVDTGPRGEEGFNNTFSI
jgi:hypothetical protein